MFITAVCFMFLIKLGTKSLFAYFFDSYVSLILMFLWSASSLSDFKSKVSRQVISHFK